MRIVGIDYGKARIGVALSDPSKKLAFPFRQVKGGMKELLEVLKPYLSEIETIVVGLPLLMNNKKGEMAELASKFAEELKKHFSCPIVLWDERLSSKHADKILQELPMSRKERTEKVDASAAATFLQSYLDSLPSA